VRRVSQDVAASRSVSATLARSKQQGCDKRPHAPSIEFRQTKNSREARLDQEEHDPHHSGAVDILSTVICVLNFSTADRVGYIAKWTIIRKIALDHAQTVIKSNPNVLNDGAPQKSAHVHAEETSRSYSSE
jgi:hypothetical protein